MSLIPELIPSKVGVIPTFDARIFQVPSLDEASNLVLWRWLDARKNSISMAAQAHFSPKQLHGKDGDARLEMLSSKGVDWNSYPDHLKWGTFVQRKKVLRELTEEELDRIPEAFRPDGPIEKSDVTVVTMPPLIDCANRVDVLLGIAEPIITGPHPSPDLV